MCVFRRWVVAVTECSYCLCVGGFGGDGCVCVCVCFVEGFWGCVERRFVLIRWELAVPDGPPTQPNSATLKTEAALFYETWEQ